MEMTTNLELICFHPIRGHSKTMEAVFKKPPRTEGKAHHMTIMCNEK